MKSAMLSLVPFVLALLLVVGGRNLAGSAEEAGTTIPMKEFPNAFLTIFPLTVFTSGERWENAADTGPVMEGSGWPNETQVLWLFARTVRDYVRKHPAGTDCVLFPDYWFNPRGQVRAVHCVVCDRTGDWVRVED